MASSTCWLAALPILLAVMPGLALWLVMCAACPGNLGLTLLLPLPAGNIDACCEGKGGVANDLTCPCSTAPADQIWECCEGKAANETADASCPPTCGTLTPQSSVDACCASVGGYTGKFLALGGAACATCRACLPTQLSEADRALSVSGAHASLPKYLHVVQCESLWPMHRNASQTAELRPSDHWLLPFLLQLTTPAPATPATTRPTGPAALPRLRMAPRMPPALPPPAAP